MGDEMAEKKNIPEGIYDIVIVGGGPAGLTAGIYASRGRMNVLLLESFSVMGQATMTDMIENYPGVERSSGIDLVMSFKKQAENFGLKTVQGTVKSISAEKEGDLDIWNIKSDSGHYKTLSVVVASGASSRKLDVPGEKELAGKGVSYCATCDGAFFREKDIVVVGGGDTAVEEALYLTKFGKKVTLIHRRDRLRATKILQERALASDKMSFVWDSVVEEIKGGQKVEKVVLRNVKTGESSELSCDGVFVFVGWLPNTGFIKDVVKLDAHDCVPVDGAMKTSASGIFACGDCCSKVLHQVVTAAGDGATAAFSAQRFVEELKGTAYK
jgi:thioredoxin reductase (NADPH)